VLTQTFLKQPGEFLLDLLFPPRCVNCKAGANWFCDACLGQVPYLNHPVCARCGTPAAGNAPCNQCGAHPLTAIDAIRSAAYFEDNPVRPAIHFLKYREHKAVAVVLGRILADAVNRFTIPADVIMPVPLHPSRYRERGYNQSALLAHALGQVLSIPVDTSTLYRTKKTKTQMTLTAAERRENTHGAFACKNERLARQTVLLIDDVCTTGSTLDACALALKESGVACVWGLTVAKAR
jgi:ComF family protein